VGVLDERQPLLKFVRLGLLDGELVHEIRVGVFFQGVGMRLEWMRVWLEWMRVWLEWMRVWLEWMRVFFEGVGVWLEWMRVFFEFVHSHGKLFYACRCGDPILLDTRWNDHSIYY